MSARYLLTWLGCMLLILLASQYIFVQAHEEAHSRICEYFGGQAHSLTLNVFGESSVACANLTRADYAPYYIQAQSDVDAFGYQLGTVMMVFIVVVFVAGAFFLALRGADK